MIRFFFYAAVIVSLQTTASAGIRVGNPGEGVCHNKPAGMRTCPAGKIYLRDLYAANLHLSPVIGPDTDPEFIKALANSSLDGLKLSKPSKDLLARKLNDLSRFQLHMGHFVLAAINSYAWELSDEPMALLPNDGTFPEIPDSDRIAIANRFQSTIFIQREAWQQLPEEHKIALIMHEAIFALIQPQCGHGVCVQQGYIVREIVARIFSGYYGKNYSLTGAQKELLGCNYRPAGAIKCDYGHKNLSISLWKKSRSSLDSGYRKVSEDSILDGDNENHQTDLVDHFCAKNYGGRRSSTASARIHLEMSREPYDLLQFGYPVPANGPFHSIQTGLKLSFRAGKAASIYSFQGESDCRHTLETDVADWYRGERQASLEANQDPCAPVDLGNEIVNK